MRVREYLKKELETKCNSQLMEKKSCVINEKCIDESLMSITDKKSKFFHNSVVRLYYSILVSYLIYIIYTFEVS